MTTLVPLRRALRLLGLVAVVALLGSGCSLRTAGSPRGDLELTAEFDDVANLVVGHSVQVADVTVGTVTDIELIDNRRARVTMSIEDGMEFPVGTSAALSKTSLLGEQYIELRVPDPDTPVIEERMLASGDEIGETLITAEFETVTERAIEFLGAISADDIGTITSTGARAVGGRGQELNQLLQDLTTVVADLDSQRLEITRTIDGFAQLGEDLADGEDQVVTLIDDLSDASVTLARNRQRIIGALRGIRDMTQVTNRAVLAEHTEEIVSTIQDLDPILSTLAGQRPLVEEVLDTVTRFLPALADWTIRDATTPAQAQYVWTRGIATPSGNLGDGPPPGPPGGGGPPMPLPDPSTVQGAANQALNTLLGLLGDPGVRLPRQLCRQLAAMELGLDLRNVCGPRPGSGGGGNAPVPTPLPDPAGTVDELLGGVGG
ncbi:MAG TPA: MlaD family protein [Acidimicrobiales bacterium]|nr:MlaD family protein [Acidimicrobiales bacterium]